MAFLYAEARFGPELDPLQAQVPGPCSYTTPPDSNLPVSSNRNGTFGFHDKTRHYDQIVLADVVAKAPMTDESPGPAVYSPLAEGQFPHAYTMRDVLAIRKASAQQFKRERRYDPQYSAHLLPEKDPELETAKLRGFLGPGSYEVGKDTNQEKIATEFSFGKEVRPDILEMTFPCRSRRAVSSSPGPDKYRPETTCSAVRSVSTIAQSPFDSKHFATSMSRARSDQELQRIQDVSAYSKELAKSYRQMSRSVKKLERCMTSFDTKALAFERLGVESKQKESYRRGPGSYNLNCQPQTEQEHELAHPWRHSTTFGGTKSRELLVSMVAAGHINAGGLGPGVYDPVNASTFHVPTHNATYKPKLSKHRIRKTKPANNSDTIEDAAPEEALDAAERWRAFKRGPSLQLRK